MSFGFRCGAEKLVAGDFRDLVAQGHHGAGAEGAQFGDSYRFGGAHRRKIVFQAVQHFDQTLACDLCALDSRFAFDALDAPENLTRDR